MAVSLNKIIIKLLQRFLTLDDIVANGIIKTDPIIDAHLKGTSESTGCYTYIPASNYATYHVNCSKLCVDNDKQQYLLVGCMGVYSLAAKDTPTMTFYDEDGSEVTKSIGYSGSSSSALTRKQVYNNVHPLFNPSSPNQNILRLVRRNYGTDAARTVTQIFPVLVRVGYIKYEVYNGDWINTDGVWQNVATSKE